MIVIIIITIIMIIIIINIIIIIIIIIISFFSEILVRPISYQPDVWSQAPCPCTTLRALPKYYTLNPKFHLLN